MPEALLSTLPVPAWTRQTLAQAGASAYVEVDGAALHYLHWNMTQLDKPVLLFIHGFRAHAHWWDAVAPFFIEHYRVLAMDFSGMGDSDRRLGYGVERLALDITGLIDALQLGTVTAIAHSYGGARLLRSCADRPELFRHAIIVDSFVAFHDAPRPVLPKMAGTRIHADFELACARFRLMPEQEALPELLAHVARHALGQVEGGWRLKFDPEMGASGEQEIDARLLLPRINTPVDCIYGQHSKVVSAALAQRIVDHLPNARGPIAIPDSHHHLMLDQPLALVATLRALLASAP